MFNWFADIIDLVSLAWHFKSVLWHGSAYFKDANNADQFCQLLKDRGAFFIKLGQWAAQRTDIDLPPVYFEKMKEMQTDAPRHSWQETIEVCKPLDLSGIHFEDLDATTMLPVPIKSGSIAQVYRVRSSIKKLQQLSESMTNGQSTFFYNPESEASEKEMRFAFKVCHPRVAEVYAQTLKTVKNLYLLAQWWMGKNSILSMVNIHDIVTQEFQRQTNLICEAQQCLNIRDDFFKNHFATTPFPCFASENFFFIEYVEDAIFYDEIGVSGKDSTVYSNQMEIEDTKMLAKQITLAAFFQMVLYNGRSHGDCHSGNILYRLKPKDRSKYLEELQEVERHAVQGRPLRVAPVNICVFFIDFGIVVDIDDALRHAMLDLTVSLNACDSRLMAKAFERVLVDREKMCEEKMLAFRADCELANIRLQEQDKIGPGTTLQDQVKTVLDTFRKHRMCLEASALRVIISWMLIDQNTPVVGREDNLPDNTIRWVSSEDLDDRFHLHEITSFIIGARESRILNEKERDKGKEVVFTAPNLDALRAKQQKRRENALDILDVLESQDEIQKPMGPTKGSKKKRIVIE